MYPTPCIVSNGYQLGMSSLGAGIVMVPFSVSGSGISRTLSPTNVSVVHDTVVKMVTPPTNINNFRMRARPDARKRAFDSAKRGCEFALFQAARPR